MICLLILLVSSGSIEVGSNSPVCVRWVSQKTQYTLHIYHYSAYMNIEALPILVLPESFRLIDQQIEYSDGIAVVYEGKRWEAAGLATWVYWVDGTIMQVLDNQSIQKSIVPITEAAPPWSSEQVYLKVDSHEEVYRVMKELVNVESTCGVLSPMSEILLAHHCRSLTPLELIHHQHYTSTLTAYIIKQKQLQVRYAQNNTLYLSLPEQPHIQPIQPSYQYTITVQRTSTILNINLTNLSEEHLFLTLNLAQRSIFWREHYLLLDYNVRQIQVGIGNVNGLVLTVEQNGRTILINAPLPTEQDNRRSQQSTIQIIHSRKLYACIFFGLSILIFILAAIRYICYKRAKSSKGKSIQNTLSTTYTLEDTSYQNNIKN